MATMEFEKFPVKVVTGGRTYKASTQEDLRTLLAWLNQGELRLANRFRIGKSWPRGLRAIKRERNKPMPISGHSRDVILSNGGVLYVGLEKCSLADFGEAERVLFVAITDAMAAYEGTTRQSSPMTSPGEERRCDVPMTHGHRCRCHPDHPGEHWNPCVEAIALALADGH